MTTTQMTQGAFSYLPALTDEEITMQVERAIRLGWMLAIEHTDAPAPRNHYWELFGLPQFDDLDAATPSSPKSTAAAPPFPDHYVKVNALDPTGRAPDHRPQLHRAAAGRPCLTRRWPSSGPRCRGRTAPSAR